MSPFDIGDVMAEAYTVESAATSDEPMGGCDLLDAVEAFIARFVALPSEATRIATTLWVAHAHAVDAFESTPRIAFLSPEPASGKTRALEVVDLLVPYAMHAVNATPAALFRSVSDLDHRPTVLFDEIDTVFGPKAKENEELRGLLNAGHRRSGVAYRCVGEGTKQTVVAFPAYCAVALAGLGDLPDTILTRSVVVNMRRRAPGETVEPFRHRDTAPVGHALRERLADWTREIAERLEAARPAMPEGVVDRPADVWEPLLAIADAAGGDWPSRARRACSEIVNDATDREPSLGIRLLADVRVAFENHDRLSTEELLSELHAMDDAPWRDLRGKPLDSRGLSRRLKPYGASSRDVRTASGSRKGYVREDLHDAWVRYLPQGKWATSATTATAQVNGASSVADVSRLSPMGDTSATPRDALTSDVAPVADVAHLRQGPPEKTCRVCGDRMDDLRDGHDTHPGC